MKNRFQRQAGLVYQNQLEQKSIEFIGYSPVLSTALLNCAFLNLGRHGTIYIDTDVIAKKHHVATDILIKKEDVGKNIAEVYKKNIATYNEDINIVCGKPTHSVDMTIVLYKDIPTLSELKVSNYLFCCLTIDGFYLGKTPYTYTGESAGQLTVTLAHLASGILIQEVLKSLNCIRPVTIVESSLQTKFVIKSPLVAQYFKEGAEDRPPFEVQRGDQTVQFEPVTQTKEDEGVFTVDLGQQFPELLDNFRITKSDEENRNKEIEEYLFSFFGWCSAEGGHISCSDKIETVSIKKLDATIFGVGALGSWSASMLALSEISQLHLNLVDADMEVEASNLNRQLLYTQSIGLPKVYEAEKRLKEIKKDIDIHIYPLEVNEGFLDLFDVDMEVDYQHPSKIQEDEETDIPLLQSLMLVKDLHSSSLMSCLDSMGARWVVEQIASKTENNNPMVNAGTSGFYVSADLIRYDEISSYDENLVERYGASIKDKIEHHSCTGELPIPSIVTSTVIASALEVLFLLTAHIKDQPKSFFSFSEKQNSIINYSYVKPF